MTLRQRKARKLAIHNAIGYILLGTSGMFMFSVMALAAILA